ncbi:MAG: type II secretion system F family protein [Planctomycetes bacterium]|nr:type II secretion system F family protein [Planctomycetota bacterium]
MEPERDDLVRSGPPLLGPSPLGPSPNGPWAAALSADDLILLNEEIAGMARAGLPLDQGLAVLAGEMGRSRLQTVTAHLADDLRQGRSLSEALDRQAGKVPPFYGALVAAGVRSGRIGDVLSTMTVYARAIADLRATVSSALVYPTLVLCFALALFGLVFYFLLPHFEKIFTDFHMKLSAFTEWIFALSHRPIYFVVVPAVLLGMVLLSWVFLRFSKKGRVAWARWVYMLPIAGGMVRSARLAAFTDLLGILVDHKVPLPEALRLAGEASSDPVMAAAAPKIVEALSQGKPLGEALRLRRGVPALLAWMAGLGEKRGQLGAALHQVSAMYRRQVELRSAYLRTVLPPILVILTAGIILVLFVVTMLLPMSSLMEGLTGAKK